MENFSDIINFLIDPEKIIHYGGFTLLLLIIFSETGILLGFIFPGDSLLFAAGLLCGTQDLDVHILVLLTGVTIAAITGNISGYYTGVFIGKKLYYRKNSMFFKKKYLDDAHSYYEKYGGVSLILSRFLPVIRTFVPIIAGTIGMNFWKYNVYNVSGAIIWVWTIIPLGYFIGKKVPAAAMNIEYFIVGITIIAMTITIVGYIRRRRQGRA